MNAYRKGRRREYATQRVLERCGYFTFRMAGSHSPIDVIALGPADVRLIQVKSGTAKVTPLEREKLKTLPNYPWASLEIWRWPDGAREPLIEVVA